MKFLIMVPTILGGISIWAFAAYGLYCLTLGG